MNNRIRLNRQTQAYPTARELAAALGGHKIAGGWLARCPSHRDKTPSLSIVDGRCGRPIVHCFGGCAWRDVLDRLTDMGLWPRFEREARR
jgi:putative DNA primase/helicase